MQASNNTQTQDNWFNQRAPAPFKSNRRLGIRFLRNDIFTTLRKINAFSLGLPMMNKDLPVTLIDISSKGISVETDFKLSINKKIVVTVRFPDFKTFEIPSKVVRKTENGSLVYGIKFDRPHSRLAEYLLATQKNLTFK